MIKKLNDLYKVLGKAKIWFIVGFLIIQFLYISHVTNLLTFQEVPKQSLGIVLEIILTAIITTILLNAQTTEQTNAELKKERFAVLFAKKSETYDAYLNDLVTIANRGSITKEEFLKLVDDLNFKLGMYVSDEANDSIAKQLEIIGSNHEAKTIKTCVFNIAHELKNDLQVGL